MALDVKYIHVFGWIEKIFDKIIRLWFDVWKLSGITFPLLDTIEIDKFFIVKQYLIYCLNFYSFIGHHFKRMIGMIIMQYIGAILKIILCLWQIYSHAMIYRHVWFGIIDWCFPNFNPSLAGYEKIDSKTLGH